MSKTLFLCAALTALVASSLPAHAIGYGQVTASPDYASVGAVDQISETFLYGTRGSAVLIAPSWVLTAAHVVDRPLDSGTSFAIRLGGVHYEISSIILHPDYDKHDAQPADLALLQLATPVLTVAPAVLLDNTAIGLPLVTEQITLAGYGLTSPHSNDAGTLRIGTAFIATTASSRYTTAPGNAVALPGDSGGPSFLHDGLQATVVGIHHTYFDTGGSNFANIDILPGAYRSFIDTYATDAVWREQPHPMPQGPASSAELVVTQGANDLRGQITSDGNLIALTGGAAATSPVGQWMVNAPDYAANGTEQWGITFFDYDDQAGTVHTLDATLEYAVELADIDWIGYDPIDGVPRSLLTTVAALTLYDANLSAIYTGLLNVSLTGNDFLSAGFRPLDLAPTLTSFSGFLLTDITVTASVPEPATAAVLAVGLLLLPARRRPWKSAACR